MDFYTISTMRFLLCASVFGVVASGHASFSFTFDSNAQGWTKGDLGSSFATIDNDVAGPANWNAGGFLAGNDHSSYAFLFSPDLGGGHGDLYGNQLTLDFQTSSGGPKDPFIVLKSSTDFLILERVNTASSGLQSISIDLSEAADWSINSSDYYGTPVLATGAQIQAVLSDLRYLGVSTDINNGGDSTMLDNVNAVPEPATLLALGASALVAARKRRGK